MIRSFSLLNLFIFLFFHSVSGALVISSHNLQWYGLGGHPRSYISEDENGVLRPANEYRDYHLKAFFEKHLADSDIVFFQEVVAVQHFIQRVVPEQFRCETYQGTYKWKHQFILACVKLGLKVSFEAFPELIIDGANLRPGLIVNLLNEDASVKLRMLGVHLKAGGMFDEVATRIRNRQLAVLAEWIKNQKDEVPAILLGDFNLDSRNKNDSARALFEEIGLVEHSNFKSSLARSTRIFDRFFVSEMASSRVKSSRSFLACEDGQIGFDEKDNYLDGEFFYRFVSDHCPVRLELEGF